MNTRPAGAPETSVIAPPSQFPALRKTRRARLPQANSPGRRYGVPTQAGNMPITQSVTAEQRWDGEPSNREPVKYSGLLWADPDNLPALKCHRSEERRV